MIGAVLAHVVHDEFRSLNALSLCTGRKTYNLKQAPRTYKALEDPNLAICERNLYLSKLYDEPLPVLITRKEAMAMESWR
jgi:hypothetical protein